MQSDADDPHDGLPDTLAELERERAKAEELVRLSKSFVDDWDQRMKESDAITAAGMLRYKLEAMDRHAKAQQRLHEIQAKIARVKAQ